MKDSFLTVSKQILFRLMCWCSKEQNITPLRTAYCSTELNLLKYRAESERKHSIHHGCVNTTFAFGLVTIRFCILRQLIYVALFTDLLDV